MLSPNGKVTVLHNFRGVKGRAVVVIIAAIAELERSLIAERVKAEMRRAKMEGRHIGRRPLDLDRAFVLRDRECGMSLTEVAKAHRCRRAMVSKIVHDARKPAGHKETVTSVRVFLQRLHGSRNAFANVAFRLINVEHHSLELMRLSVFLVAYVHRPVFVCHVA